MAKRCDKCGSLLMDNETFCPNCGANVIENAPDMNAGYAKSATDTSAAPNGQYGAPYGAPYNTSYNAQYNPQYNAQYNSNMYAQPGQEQEMTVGQWLGTILLTTLFGIISIILLFVWGFGTTGPESRRRYCKAMLIVELISIVIGFIFGLIFSTVLAANWPAIERFLEDSGIVATPFISGFATIF